jgi:hypothetical protein|tara:strand:- start:281 stop:733 length:453 start_codon:yes stop_codon:yes gene_type:complete
MNNNKPNNILKFISVEKTLEHIEVLYSLLKKRAHKISHINLPKFQEHKNFALNHPYIAWYLIQMNGEWVGTVYLLENNTISFFLEIQTYETVQQTLRWMLDNHSPLPGIPSERNANFIFNAPITNNSLQSILNDLGAQEVQITYVLTESL